MSSPVMQFTVRNRLLRALPPSDFRLLAAHLSPISLPLRAVVEGPDTPSDGAVFIESGICSVLVTGLSGHQAEAGHLGKEGMSGRHVLLGAPSPARQMLVQVAGSGLRIGASALAAAMAESVTLRDLLLRYVQTVETQVAHSMLAVTRFNVHQRLARWLLMCHDRIEGDELPLTHEALATMLSVRRASVTQEIQVLEGLGTLRATRGKVRILDRARLIDISAGCYGIPEAEYDSMLLPVADRAVRAAASR